MSREMYHFETAQFVIRATIEPDYDCDLSFDDSGETYDRVSSGDWECFATTVTVTHKATGIVLGEDTLCGSIYADPAEFFTAHRNSPAEYRNTLANKARRISICHYFPEMVRIATAQARDMLKTLAATKVA